MSAKYKEEKDLNFARMAGEILDFWKKENVFEKSVTNREGSPSFTFYEGPPSANGTPGIHHVMARTIKDIFCRFKTLEGYQVKRKGGWDTHGLPVELQVEKQLGITKDDIGKKISIEEYNQKCRETVMMYKDQWDDLTMKMGYWVDLKNPYITYQKEYIESLWWILKQLYNKGLLYKGYTIQPYSPSDGTGLSSHELNLPGCYKEVKDTSIVAQFKVKRNPDAEFLFEKAKGDVFILAWTTTPWTLPSNTALAVGEKINYVQINTFNVYTYQPISVVLAKDLVGKYFTDKQKDVKLEDYKQGDKIIPYEIVNEFQGKQLVGFEYEQLMPYVQPLYDADKAFKVVAGDFVTTEEGTGVVHTSPTFGADDFRVAKQYGIPPLTVKDESGNEVPTVDKKGKFIREIGTKLKDGVAKYRIKTHRPLSEDDFYVKNYTDEDEEHPDYKTTDVIISIILKEENKAFKVEKYEHTYPHSWRTDKPVLYYPLDAWFIKTTALKDRMVELNKTINWKPESTGIGRFGNWLENLVDWNLSRSRYWGTPLPIWLTSVSKDIDDPDFIRVVGSLEEFKIKGWHYLKDEFFVLLEELKIAKGKLFEEFKNAFEEHIKNFKYSAPKLNDVLIKLNSKKTLTIRDLNELGIPSRTFSHCITPMSNVTEEIDLHRPFVDRIIYIDPLRDNEHLVMNGNQVFERIFVREPDLIDVWFDSGAMPYAQWGLSQTLSRGKGFNYHTADPGYYKLLSEFCKEHRNNPTQGEKILWQHLKGNRLGGYHFRRQHIIDKYIADFVCLSKKVIIEIDGLYHSLPDVTESDELRTQRLRHLGYEVIRFSNSEVIANTDVVLNNILAACKSRQTDVSSLPFGEGWGGAFPADFISEGVDQTRGWFFTLHAISVLLFDSVSFKNVISTGLVLDKYGNKMSKRLGNVVNPFEALDKYGPDVVRWYMVENAPPWDNLRFNFNGIVEVQRKFFGTLLNTYSFFALYANIDGFVKDELDNVPYDKLTHLDRWIISKLQSLVKEVTAAYEEYEPHRAARAIQDFVNDQLSNWYVRLNRKRFWKGNYSEDKKAAYETLYECLMVTAQLMSPIAPFFSEWLYIHLTENIREKAVQNNTPLRHASVHLTDLTKPEENRVDVELEKSMDYAQRICSLVHSIRKNAKIKVRTPLQRILLPVLDASFAKRIKSVEEIILAEVNVKAIEYIDDTSGVLVKKVKPNFAKLGKQYGPKMKDVSAVINSFTKEEIAMIEKHGTLSKGGFDLVLEDVLISSEDIPGWSVASEGGVTVALDVTITDALKKEGIARDFINRVQNLRKDMGLEVLDKINIEVEKNGELVTAALTEYKEYISIETQALTLELKDELAESSEVDMDEFVLKVKVSLARHQ